MVVRQFQLMIWHYRFGNGEEIWATKYPLPLMHRDSFLQQVDNTPKQKKLTTKNGS